MTQVNVVRLDLMEPSDRDYAQKQVGMFLERIGGFVPEVAVLEISLTEVRKKEDNIKARFDVRMESSFGIHQAHSEGWNKIKVLMDALNNLEKQVRKNRKRIEKK